MSTTLTQSHDTDGITLATRPTRRSLDASIGMRFAAIAALGGIAWAHYVDVADKLNEVFYLGVGYILLIAACVLSAGMLVARSVRIRRAGWMLGGAAALGTMVGFTLTRTTGLPQATEDIGNWSEPIAIWSLVFEGVMVTLAAVALWPRRRSR